MKHSRISVLGILFFISVFGSPSLRAQSPKVETLLDQADIQAQIEKQIILDALLLAKATGDKLGLAECYYRMALYYERIGVPELSIEELEKAQDIYLNQVQPEKHRRITHKIESLRSINSRRELTDKQQVLQLANEVHRLRAQIRQRSLAGLLFVLVILAIFYSRQNRKMQEDPDR
ncbi:MAG: hypothetical protein AAF587_39880 [Bacteroidota bacterium]